METILIQSSYIMFVLLSFNGDRAKARAFYYRIHHPLLEELMPEMPWLLVRFNLSIYPMVSANQ